MADPVSSGGVVSLESEKNPPVINSVFTGLQGYGASVGFVFFSYFDPASLCKQCLTSFSFSASFVFFEALRRSIAIEQGVCFTMGAMIKGVSRTCGVSISLRVRPVL